MARVHQDSAQRLPESINLDDRDAILAKYKQEIEEECKRTTHDQFRAKLDKSYPSMTFAFVYFLAAAAIGAGMIAVEVLFAKSNGLFSSFYGGIWSGIFTLIAAVFIFIGARNKGKGKEVLLFWILNIVQLCMILAITGCIVPHALSSQKYDGYCEVYDIDCDNKSTSQLYNKVLIALGSLAVVVELIFLLHNLVFSRIERKVQDRQENRI